MAYELDADTDDVQKKKKLATVGSYPGAFDASAQPQAAPATPLASPAPSAPPLVSAQPTPGSAAPAAAPPAPATPAAPPPVVQPSASPAVDPYHQYETTEGMTPAEVNAYWAKKQPLGIVGGGTTGLTGNAQTGVVDPGAAIAHQTALANSAGNVVQRAQAAGAADLSARNATSAATNLAQAGKDFDEQSASIEKVGGLYPDKDKARAEYIAGGAGAITPQAGTQLGDKTTVVPSFPTDKSSATVTTPGGSQPGATVTSTAGYNPNSMTQFTETENLRDKQINPTDSARLDSMDALVNAAANKVGNGANRGDIAQQYLDVFDKNSEPGIRDGIRSVGQRAASLGRIGMGDTAVEAFQPYQDYLNKRASLSKELAADSASGDISDRLNNLSALSGIQGQTFGQETISRNEYRTEREYQEALNRKAIEDAVRQYQLGESSKQNEFGRNATQAQMLLNAGQQSGAKSSADWQALASLIAPYLFPKQSAA